MKSKIVFGLAAATMAGGLVWQHREIQSVRADNASLRKQRSAAPPAAPAASLDPAEAARLNDEHLELMRLRGQYQDVIRLRGEKAAMQARYAKLRTALAAATSRIPAQNNPVSMASDLSKESPEVQSQVRNRVAALKSLGVDGRLWAMTHGDQLSVSLDEMREAARGPFPAQAILDQIEFLSQPRALTESDGPATLLMRTQPIQLRDGGWLRSYLWVDGAVENYVSADGNFNGFELLHTAIEGAETASGNLGSVQK